MTPEPCAASPFAARLPRQATPRADWPPPRVSGLQTPLSPLRPRPQQIINNRVKLEGQRGGAARGRPWRADGGRTRGGLGGEEGEEGGSGPGRHASIRARNLQKLGEAGLPARRALGPQGPGGTERAEPVGGGGAGWAGAEPGCAEARGRSLAARAGGGGALHGLAQDARRWRLARLFTSTRVCYF